MNICKTCAHWGCKGDTDPILADHTYCSHPANGSTKPDGFGHEVQYGSYPSEYCGITTGPDFGCIHHEAKYDDSE